MSKSRTFSRWNSLVALLSPLVFVACSGGGLNGEPPDRPPVGPQSDDLTYTITDWLTFDTDVSTTTSDALTADSLTTDSMTVVTGGHIRGTVDTDATPLEGVEIDVTDGPSQPSPFFSDAMGQWDTGRLDVGTYTLTWSRAGYRHVTATGVPVLNRKTTTVDCSLEPTGTVLGVVIDSGTQQPLVGATVHSGAGSTTTDDTGHYELDEVDLGGADVTATMPSYFDSTANVVLEFSGDTRTLDFQLLAGATISGVVDSDGTPLEGASVEISNDQIDNETLLTAADGSYTSPLTPVGTYGVTCRKLGYASQSSVVTITVGTNTVVNCSLPDITTISGTVTDRNGAPLNGVAVSDGGVTAITNTQGFYLLNAVPTGTTTVTAALNGYLPSSADVTLVTSTDDVVQNLVLTPGGVFSRVPTSGIDQQNTTGFPSGTRTLNVDDGTSFAQSDADASYCQTTTGLSGYLTSGYLNIPDGTTRSVTVNWSAKSIGTTGNTHVELFNGTTRLAVGPSHDLTDGVYTNFSDSFNVAVPVSSTSTAFRVRVALTNTGATGLIRFTLVWIDVADETATPPPPPPPTTFVPPPNPNNDPVIALVGDIACSPDSPNYFGGNGTPEPIGAGSLCQEKATSDVVVGQGLAAIVTVGDNQYDNGELSNFNISFDATWGRAKSLIYGVVGNHEYNNNQTTVAGFMNYFCPSSGTRAPFCPATGLPARPFYSFNVGTNWHVVVLDSDCSQSFSGGCGVGSEQEQWLRSDLAADLAAHPSGPRCQIATWHHPRIATGAHCDDPGYDPLDLYRPFWQALADYGVDVVVNGHDHDYERQPARNVDGNVDPNGIVEIVIGTGGRDLDGFPSATGDPDPGGTDCSRQPVVRNRQTFGAGKMILHPAAYDYYYQPIASQVGQTGAIDDRVLGVACH